MQDDQVSCLTVNLIDMSLLSDQKILVVIDCLEIVVLFIDLLLVELPASRGFFLLFRAIDDEVLEFITAFRTIDHW